ncbi:MAG: 30S ribosomal protein S8 [Verrucomicrobia bacterium]|jgi:small subunit ribosomal protein S8|nr:30S ribosomal protein S8 [Verrucomicrobiota bacterium]
MSTLSDPIADYLTRLRNAARANRQDVAVPYSRMKEEITRILKQEGFISGYEVDRTGRPQIKVSLKFINRTPALTGLKRVSRPGLRKYVGSEDVPRVLGGMGISILSTSRGIMTGREAKREHVGGELLAIVW